MTMPFINRNRQVQLYADAISAVWAWWDMVTDPSYALQQELDLWEILQRDPKCYQGIQQRLNNVAGPNWRVFPHNNSKKPADKLMASLVEAMLRKIPHFADARKRLAQAVFRAQSTELITGRRNFSTLADTPGQRWWIPTKLTNIDPRRFIIKPVHIPREDGSFRVRGELYMSVIPTYMAPTGVELWQGRYVKVKNTRQFVRIIYDNEESRLGFGRGIMDVLYFYHWAKQIVIREGLQGLERWAQGVPVMSIDPDKKGDTDQTSEQMAQTALDSLMKMRSRHAFVKDKDDELVFESGGMEGHQIVMGFLNYLDSCIIGVCTGASLHSANDVGSAGTYASDKVGEGIQKDVIQFDINKVDEDITTDLISLCVHLNRPQFAKVGELMNVPGLENCELPQFRTVHEDVIDPEKGATVFSTISNIKTKKPIKIRADEFYKNTGLTPPDEDDDTMEFGDTSAGDMGGGAMDPSQDPYAPRPEDDDRPGPEDKEDLFEDGSPEDDAGLFGGNENSDEGGDDAETV
jgi:hypothetical protein